jgi:hypothetical protein
MQATRAEDFTPAVQVEYPKIDQEQLQERMKGIKVGNIRDPKCIICQVPELAGLDKFIFFHAVDFVKMKEILFGSGIGISEKEFFDHEQRHLFIETEKGDCKPEDTVELLDERVSQTVQQLRLLEKRGKGKFSQAFVNRVEVTTDFKTIMLRQFEKAMAAEIIDVKPVEAPVNQKLLPAGSEEVAGASH